MLGISHKEHKTNEYVWRQVNIPAERQELLMSTVKDRKLSWFGHVCSHDTLPKFILQGTVDGSHRRGRLQKSWRGDIKVVIAEHHRRQKSIGNDRSGGVIIVEASAGVPPMTPGQLEWHTE